MNLPMFGKPAPEKKTKAVVFSAEVNGVKLTAPDQDSLMKMVTAAQGLGTPTTNKPKPTAAKPGPQPVPQPAATPGAKKWNAEELKAALDKDFHAAIVSVVSQELGLKSLKETFEGISSVMQMTYGLAQGNAIAQTLNAHNIEPTSANIEEFRGFLSARPQNEQMPTPENLVKVAKEAVDNKWLDVRATPDAEVKLDAQGNPLKALPAGTEQTTKPGANVLEGKFPARGLETQPGADADADKNTGSEVKEIETWVDETPVEEIIATLQAASQGGDQAST